MTSTLVANSTVYEPSLGKIWPALMRLRAETESVLNLDRAEAAGLEAYLVSTWRPIMGQYHQLQQHRDGVLRDLKRLYDESRAIRKAVEDARFDDDAVNPEVAGVVRHLVVLVNPYTRDLADIQTATSMWHTRGDLLAWFDKIDRWINDLMVESTYPCGNWICAGEVVTRRCMPPLGATEYTVTPGKSTMSLSRALQMDVDALFVATQRRYDRMAQKALPDTAAFVYESRVQAHRASVLMDTCNMRMGNISATVFLMREVSGDDWGPERDGYARELLGESRIFDDWYAKSPAAVKLRGVGKWMSLFDDLVGDCGQTTFRAMHRLSEIRAMLAAIWCHCGCPMSI